MASFLKTRLTLISNRDISQLLWVKYALLSRIRVMSRLRGINTSIEMKGILCKSNKFSLDVLYFIETQRRLIQEDCCGGCGSPSDRDRCYVRAAAHLNPHRNIHPVSPNQQAVSMASWSDAVGFHIGPLG